MKTFEKAEENLNNFRADTYLFADPTYTHRHSEILQAMIDGMRMVGCVVTLDDNGYHIRKGK